MTMTIANWNAEIARYEALKADSLGFAAAAREEAARLAAAAEKSLAIAKRSARARLSTAAERYSRKATREANKAARLEAAACSAEGRAAALAADIAEYEAIKAEKEAEMNNNNPQAAAEAFIAANFKALSGAYYRYKINGAPIENIVAAADANGEIRIAIAHNGFFFPYSEEELANVEKAAAVEELMESDKRFIGKFNRGSDLKGAFGGIEISSEESENLRKIRVFEAGNAHPAAPALQQQGLIGPIRQGKFFLAHAVDEMGTRYIAARHLAAALWIENAGYIAEIEQGGAFASYENEKGWAQKGMMINVERALEILENLDLSRVRSAKVAEEAKEALMAELA